MNWSKRWNKCWAEGSISLMLSANCLPEISSIRRLNFNINYSLTENLRFLSSSGLVTLNEISNELSLSVTTISTYRFRIMDKMKLHTNADIIRYVIEHELVWFRLNFAIQPVLIKNPFLDLLLSPLTSKINLQFIT